MVQRLESVHDHIYFLYFSTSSSPGTFPWDHMAIDPVALPNKRDFIVGHLNTVYYVPQGGSKRSLLDKVLSALCLRKNRYPRRGHMNSMGKE
jgi:hypothetical protein